MNLSQYGFSPELLPENAQGLPARITAVHRGRFALISEVGEGYGKLKSAEYDSGLEEYPTVGDFVLIHPVPGGDSQIIRTLPRKSFFSRRDPDRGRGEQIIAANFCQAFTIPSDGKHPQNILTQKKRWTDFHPPNVFYKT